MSDIYYIHQGVLPNYLLYSLANTRAINPTARIFLIADRFHYITPKLDVCIINFDQLESDKHRHFLSEYRHLSGNPVEFERFCFSRWFYLESAMQIKDSKFAIHLDSDCLLFSEVSELKKFMDGDSNHYCFGPKGQPHLALFSSGLKELTDFMIHSFRSELFIDWEKSGRINRRQYFCDMAVMTQFSQIHSEKFAPYPLNEKFVVEQNMGVAENYQLWPGPKLLKRVQWRLEKGLMIPYLLNFTSGKYQRAIALHYKGSAKRRIYEFNKPNQGQFLSKLKASFHNFVPPLNRWPIIMSYLKLFGSA